MQLLWMPEGLDTTAFALGCVAAFLVGLNKTGLPGVALVSVSLMAGILPAKMSVGALLPMLLVADFFAVFRYHRHARWRYLLVVMPWIGAGIAAGSWFLGRVQNTTMKPLLGCLVLGLLVLDFVRLRLHDTRLSNSRWFSAFCGVSAGFATTVGNAAGPITAIYFLTKGLDKEEFMGTRAWYFMIFNAIKLPIFKHNGMITAATLSLDLAVIPAIALGAITGIKLLPHIRQNRFEWLVRILAALTAMRLIFS